MANAIDWHRNADSPCETCGARCGPGTPHRALTDEESDTAAAVLVDAGYVVCYGMMSGPYELSIREATREMREDAIDALKAQHEADAALRETSLTLLDLGLKMAESSAALQLERIRASRLSLRKKRST